MANYYVRSSAAGTADGSNWTNAFTTLAAAFSGKAAGDVFWLADDHAETQASVITLSSPGTAANPCRVLCVNTHVTTPPTGEATTATISTTGANNIIYGNSGYVYIKGVTLNAGDSSSSASFSVGNAAYGWVAENCNFNLRGTGSSGRFNAGGTSSSAKDEYVCLINTPITFSNTSQIINLAAGRFIWKNTASAIGGTVPTSLMSPQANASTEAVISGCDLSAAGSGKNLVSVSQGTQSVNTIRFRNCKLGASVNVMTSTIPGPAATEVYLENGDSGNTNYRMEHYKFQGKIVTESTIVRTSGASDGTTTISHKFVSLTSGPTLFSPLQGPWMVIWNDTTGSSKQVTVEIVHDSLTALTDGEVWLEVEGLATSSFPQSVYYDDRVANAFASAVSQTSSSVTWTTTGLTNPNKQSLDVSFTPQVKGPIRARVCLAKSNYTIYADPLLTVA